MLGPNNYGHPLVPNDDTLQWQREEEPADSQRDHRDLFGPPSWGWYCFQMSSCSGYIKTVRAHVSSGASRMGTTHVKDRCINPAERASAETVRKNPETETGFHLHVQCFIMYNVNIYSGNSRAGSFTRQGFGLTPSSYNRIKWPHWLAMQCWRT